MLIEQIDKRDRDEFKRPSREPNGFGLCGDIIIVALNIGMDLARFDSGTATGCTATSLVLSAVVIVLILSKILRGIWNDGARRP
jgi:hypothetical protein